MKNSIKKSLSLVTLIIALVISSSVMAQPRGNGQQRGPQGAPSIPNAKQITKMVTDLSKALTLNEDQESIITKMYTTHFEKVKEATKDGRPDRSKMEALRTNFEKEVKSVLSEDQQKLFTEYQKKHAPGQRQGQGQRPDGHRRN